MRIWRRGFTTYDPESGNYISYIHDPNSWVDVFELLNEFEIAGYGCSAHKRYGFSAHELLQNAWMRNNAVVTGRNKGIATSNPAMALQENSMHKRISKLQARYGLHNPNVLKSQTALQNRNTAITRRGIYDDLISREDGKQVKQKILLRKKQWS